MRIFYHLGQYYIFITQVFSKPEKHAVWFRQFVKELQKLGVSSVGIVILISIFIGAAITIQTAYNMENPLLPDYLVSLATRDTMFLEFSSTIMCLILAGKVGSNIASEIGTMRVTEQIDALEIMGVNPASFLISPKVASFVLFVPILVMISMIVGITGGWIAGMMSGAISSASFIAGIQYAFIPFYIVYSIIKSLVFAFIIVTVSAYQGYYISGGALDVGKASTRAVVYCSIIILLFDLIITQLLLS
jgi:phospholipid/cholesterol/gamma-HCH transport system permease protein